jgi:ABC-type maltose transport system permease subunit
MDTSKTFKNWRWWVALPIALPIIAIVSIPRFIIFLLDFVVVALEFVDVSRLDSKRAKQFVDWVHKGAK